MWGQRSRPETCDNIDIASQHLVPVEEEICGFELNPVTVWGPVCPIHEEKEVFQVVVVSHARCISDLDNLKGQ